MIPWIWQVAFWCIWALWWGGLGFYAMVVVPIGTEQIGSEAQGFITQKVTLWHNGLCVLMTLALAAEAYRLSSRLLWVSSAILAVISAILFAGHAVLTRQMDFENQVIPLGFYSQHAIYLWVTAAEWGLGLALPWLMLKPNRSGSR